MNSARFALLLASVVLFLVGCQQAAKSPTTKEYDVIGKVTAVDADGKTVTLDHQDIPGFMQAMEMEFKVADSKVLSGIAEGDEVQGKLEVKAGDYVITSLKKR